MKKVPIYLLLLLYTCVQLKPLTAVLKDAVAHTFFAAQHMATVHYENGRYHLHTELNSIHQQEQGSASQKNTSSEKTNENLSPQTLPDKLFVVYNDETSSSFTNLPGPGLSTGFTTETFRPPSLI